MNRIIGWGVVALAGLICVAGGRNMPASRLAAMSDDVESVHAIITCHPQPMMANLTDDYRVVRLWPRSDALAAAREGLEATCDTISFHETPFRQVVTTLADKSGVRMSLDNEALENIGFDTDTPITATLTGLSFRAGLREVLEDVDLAYVLRNDHVEITSMEKAASTRETVFYPVLPGVSLDEVAHLIEMTVLPESWSPHGGPGTIVAAPAGIGNGLVISHNGAAHEEIEAILRTLDGAQWTSDVADEGVTPTFVRTYVVEDEATRVGLEDRLLSLCNASLPHGADEDAHISVIGDSIIVQSRSRPFQVMAAQIITAIIGDGQEIETEPDEPVHAATADSDT